MYVCVSHWPGPARIQTKNKNNLLSPGKRVEEGQGQGDTASGGSEVRPAEAALEAKGYDRPGGVRHDERHDERGDDRHHQEAHEQTRGAGEGFEVDGRDEGRQGQGAGHGEVTALDHRTASWLQTCVQETVTPSFEALVNFKRKRLMEVCCSPMAILSSTMDKITESESSVRCSHWNGCDLSMKNGFENARTLRHQHHPTDMWISVECGPWSQMRNVNQRTPEQCQNLEKKRSESMKVIKNAFILAADQVRDGVMFTGNGHGNARPGTCLSCAPACVGFGWS